MQAGVEDEDDEEPRMALGALVDFAVATIDVTLTMKETLPKDNDKPVDAHGWARWEAWGFLGPLLSSCL